jgi:hypothetical protein
LTRQEIDREDPSEKESRRVNPDEKDANCEVPREEELKGMFFFVLAKKVSVSLGKRGRLRALTEEPGLWTEKWDHFWTFVQ